MRWYGMGCNVIQVIVIAWLPWLVSASDTVISRVPGWPELPEIEVSLVPGVSFDQGWLGVSRTDDRYAPPVLTFERGWTAADIGFGDTEGLLLPTEIRRLRRPLDRPLEWPGMRVETDYAAVAAAGRGWLPGGVAALAGAGLLLLTARKW